MNRHLSDDRIVAYLDGELAARAAGEVNAHLDVCAQCLQRARDLKTTFAHYLEFRTHVAGDIEPPRRFDGFQAQLRQAACATPKPRRWFLPFPFPSPAFSLLSAGVAVVAVLLWVRLASAPAVSGSEFLSRAVAAEQRETSAVADPIFYQKLHLRRARTASRPEASVTFEMWNRHSEARLANRGGGPIWTEFESVYHQNRMSGRRPLAPAGYETWRNSLARRREKVAGTRLPDGSPGLMLTTASEEPASTGSLLEATLVVRAEDWHPVRETLRVQAEREVQEYEVVELAYNILPGTALEPGILSMLRTPPAAALPPPPVPLPAPRAAPLSRFVNPEKTAIDALYALHRAQACMGEPIEVRQDASAVLIRGIVESGERKREILEALHGIPGLKVEIRTAEEHFHAAESSSGPVPQAEPAEGPAGGAMLVPKELEARFTASQFTDVANRAVELADDSLVEVWALRRLAQAYPQERLAELGPESRTYLQSMVRDHARGLCQKLGGTRALLQPLGAADGAPAALSAPGFQWPAGIPELFFAIEREREIIRALFSPSDNMSFPEVARRLAAAVTAAEQRCLELERDVVLFFLQSQDQKQSNLSPD